MTSPPFFPEMYCEKSPDRHHKFGATTWSGSQSHGCSLKCLLCDVVLTAEWDPRDV